MKYNSVFDIIGPIMVGPSSSHTAGAARIGHAARALFGQEPERAEIHLYGSFARTYMGHATDVALIAGILGFNTNDPRISRATAIAKQRGVYIALHLEEVPADHPNTARIRLSRGEDHLELVGVSVGGGRVEIVELNGFRLRLAGGQTAVLVFHHDRPGAIAAVASVFAGHQVNIAHMEVSRKTPGGQALMIIEGDQSPQAALLEAVSALPFVWKVCTIDDWKRTGSPDLQAPAGEPFRDVAELVRRAERDGMPISEVMIRQEVEVSGRSRAAVLAEMEMSLQVMQEAIERGMRGGIRSVSGLTGGDAELLRRYIERGTTLSGQTVLGSVARALATNEVNAAMGTICATPTAGSAGVVPGVLFTLREQLKLEQDEALRFLLTAGAFGLVVANNACISGAAGGCQAEIGSAIGMAAAAAVEVAGGTARQSAEAMAIALKSVMGLVCDPVGGLVEIPCVKRNGIGAAIALVAADLALAGVESRIPCDEVIAAMHSVGQALPAALRETGLGGLAATPMGRELERRVFAPKRT